ncbi:MAG: squalene/phytoene synthase family protein [Chloroflexota bacterium]
MSHYLHMLAAVSRTFTLSIEQLPGIVRDSIALSYLLLRVSDCLEDHETLDVERKIILLELWDEILAGQQPANELTRQLVDLDSNDPEVYVAQQAPDLMDFLHTFPEEIQESIKTRVKRTTLGMARWQRQGPYVETEEEMDDYMHQVAGRVGYLITDIFAWYSPRIEARKEALLPLAREYGLALQTVNIIRGMRKDFERGWVFVPRTFIEQVGLTREEMFMPGNEDKAIEVVNILADKAETHLRHGLEYIAAFPMHQHRIRLACMWPLFFAVKTLALSRNNVNVLLNEVKMTRQDVKSIMRQTTLMGWSNRWLDRYYQTLSQPNEINI